MAATTALIVQPTVNGTAALTDHLSTGSITRQTTGIIYVFICHSGTFLDSPVLTVFHGTDAGTFIGAKSGAGANEVAVEVWYVPWQNDAPSATVDIAFAGGASLSIAAFATEIAPVGGASFPYASSANNSGSLSGPITVSLTSGAHGGGIGSTITVPVTDNILMCISGLTDSATSMAISAGTQISTTLTAGTGVNRILAGLADYSPPTGGSDTVSWTLSGGSPSWATFIIEIVGSVFNGIIKNDQMIPIQY